MGVVTGYWTLVEWLDKVVFLISIQNVFVIISLELKLIRSIRLTKSFYQYWPNLGKARCSFWLHYIIYIPYLHHASIPEPTVSQCPPGRTPPREVRETAVWIPNTQKQWFHSRNQAGPLKLAYLTQISSVL